MSNEKVRPLSDRVIVRPNEAKDMSSGGIVLPDSAKEKPHRGVVIAMGPGKWGDDGNRVTMTVRVGDKVIYGRYGGTPIEIGGEDHVILGEGDVLGVIEGA